MYQLDPIDNPNFWLCDTVDDLPDFTGAEFLYQDFETENNTEGILKKTDHSGLYPYKGDRICGASVTADLCPDIFYIPIRHKSLQGNIPIEAFREWLHKHLAGPNRVKNWVNHNVVFDAIFAHFEEVEFLCKLVCTLTLSKVHDSDRIGHGLKVLAAEWLDMPECAKAEWAIKDYLKSIKSKDYSMVPAERMGVYACLDAKAARSLFLKILAERPEGVEGIWETEIALAPILYDMELQGLLVDPLVCKKQLLVSLRSMIDTSTRIAELADREFTNSSTCLHDILCTKFGLPVLKTVKERDEEGRIVDTGRASFDKEALKMYIVHPEVTSNETLREVVGAIKSYRVEATYSSLFLETFIDLHDELCYIHPSYNAIVRTGRMSSRRPNSQQQNSRSKALILAPPGWCIWSSDYSQIEYRLIVHYVEDVEAIQAYIEDPRTDFHKWVAGMLRVSRSAGKVLNFGMAYGAGKRRVTLGLITNPDIIEEIGTEVNKMIEKGEVPEAHRRMVFNDLCEQRAARVYDDYHDRFPGIKRVSRQAARVCKRRGYVFNAYGRRRHLPEKAAHKAFNSIIQGCAMDIMKERMIALSPRYNKKTRDMRITLGGNVHDELFGLMPVEHMMDPEYHNYICTTLETPSIEFRVPISTGLGVSDKNWAEAAGDMTRFSNGDVREVKDGNYTGAIAGKLR